eukprot:TRINITY_DN2501_c0_g1_i4.p1 TRINITY_DN2501_c0_g1~~TRINITY_DN2501_c0_g1_i4.p1  ORF type:complete len:437 (+),score=52.64 TRINITY_DN2501_c0_g1_i4:127-1437(+)
MCLLPLPLLPLPLLPLPLLPLPLLLSASSSANFGFSSLVQEEPVYRSIDPQTASQFSASTHDMPPAVFGKPDWDSQKTDWPADKSQGSYRFSSYHFDTGHTSPFDKPQPETAPSKSFQDLHHERLPSWSTPQLKTTPSAATFSAEMAVPSFPPQPWALEPTHVVSSQPAFVLINCLLEYLRDRQVEVTLNLPKYGLKCIYYHRYYEIVFRVRVYQSATEQNMVVLEFQRRSGDGLGFYDLFNQCVEYLVQQSMITPPPQIPKFRAEPESSPLAGDDEEPLATDAIDVIQHLLNMAGSEYSDVQYEAMRALADLSDSERNQRVLLEQGGWQAASRGLLSSCYDVHRCAASTLANLAPACPQANERVLNADGCLDVLYHFVETSTHPQVVKEAARALANLFQRGVKSSGEERRKAWKILSNHTDPAIRQYAAIFVPSN